ncbi:ATP-binding protein [Streptomyces griseoincarnatus]|uniref:ATP-binding protein n=1 Tax=Promicromonospora sp. NPDC057138 TaxID=3346031 RepID=UPI00363BC664
MDFVGRTRELADLDRLLDAVRRGRRADRGTAVLLRGRRRVGKSRLATEFAERAGVPTAYFQAARYAPTEQELLRLLESVAESDLPGARAAQGARFDSLTTTLRFIASLLPDNSPSILILDELPWLLEGIQGGAGELQRTWDQHLSKKPVLLLLLGSDVAAMEQLSAHDQPFYGRAVELVLQALTPRDIAAITETKSFDAFDAHLVTGGQPLVAQEWAPGMSLDDFLGESFTHPTSALVTSGTRVLDGEFGETGLARRVLTAIGGRGERTFTKIQHAVGDNVTAATITRLLHMLQDKQVVASDEPLSRRSSLKDRRYRVADPALRFWLAFVEPSLPDVDRGRPDLALARVQAGYAAWRGRAIEPVVREALSRLLPDKRWAEVREVGGWWPRTNRPEIDLVGADTRPASVISFVGTVKWRRDKPITAADIRALAGDATSVPGCGPGTGLVAVCPAGADSSGADAVWTADDLLTAWP